MSNEPRFSHLALPVGDLVRSIEWYERFTPLRAIERRRDPGTDVAWLCHPEPTDHPFVLILQQFDVESDAGDDALDADVRVTRTAGIGRYGYLGIELPSRAAVDAMAVLGRADGCIADEPEDKPTPVGYACSLNDPDGNVVEFSYDERIEHAVIVLLAEQASSSSNDDTLPAERPSTAD